MVSGLKKTLIATAVHGSRDLAVKVSRAVQISHTTVRCAASSAAFWAQASDLFRNFTRHPTLQEGELQRNPSNTDLDYGCRNPP